MNPWKMWVDRCATDRSIAQSQVTELTGLDTWSRILQP